MKLPRREVGSHAFTLTELVVVLFTVTLLLLLMIPLALQLKQKSQRITCVNNLKNIGLSFRIFASANSNLFPTQLPALTPAAQATPASLKTRTIIDYFQSLSNELGTPILLRCPADGRKSATNFSSLRSANVSYFLGLEATGAAPTSLLAGDRNLTTNGAAAGPGVVEVTSKMTVGWTKDIHRSRGNVALGDGSVQQFTEPRFNSFLSTSGVATNRVIIP